MSEDAMVDQAEMALAQEPSAPAPESAGDGKRTRFLSQEERKRATELLMAGHNVSSIAKVLDRSIPTVSRVKKEVLKGKSWNEKRTKKRKSKFDNPDTIARVTEAWNNADGELTYDKIAQILGCSTSTAWAFVKSQGWSRPNSKKAKKSQTVASTT